MDNIIIPLQNVDDQYFDQPGFSSRFTMHGRYDVSFSENSGLPMFVKWIYYD